LGSQQQAEGIYVFISVLEVKHNYLQPFPIFITTNPHPDHNKMNIEIKQFLAKQKDERPGG
jgi:acyl transferase domain-containing protein